MAKKKTSKAPSAPAVDRAAPCSPITDAVYPPEIIDREFLEQGRNFGWGTLRDMRECARKLEYENAAMRLAIAPAVDRAAPCSPAVLTVDILKSLKFKLHLHLNGGDVYSKRVETNDEWGIAVGTETNGSPDYLITSKELYMMANHDVVMDMRKKPWHLEAFVAAYNASRANVTAQQPEEKTKP